MNLNIKTTSLLRQLQVGPDGGPIIGVSLYIVFFNYHNHEKCDYMYFIFPQDNGIITFLIRDSHIGCHLNFDHFAPWCQNGNTRNQKLQALANILVYHML